MTAPLPPASEPIEEEVPGFFEQYKFHLIGGSVLAILAILGIGGYQYYSYNQKVEAQSAFITADSEESLAEVASKYGNSTVGNNAKLELSAILRERGDLEESDQLLSEIVERSPEYALVGTAMLGLAANREIAGEIDEAISIYQQIPAKYGSSYATPLARLAEAKLLAIRGDEMQARQILETLASSETPGPVSMQAGNQLRMLPAPRDETNQEAADVEATVVEPASDPEEVPEEAAE